MTSSSRDPKPTEQSMETKEDSSASIKAKLSKNNELNRILVVESKESKAPKWMLAEVFELRNKSPLRKKTNPSKETLLYLDKLTNKLAFDFAKRKENNEQLDAKEIAEIKEIFHVLSEVFQFDEITPSVYSVIEEFINKQIDIETFKNDLKNIQHTTHTFYAANENQIKRKIAEEKKWVDENMDKQRIESIITGMTPEAKQPGQMLKSLYSEATCGSLGVSFSHITESAIKEIDKISHSFSFKSNQFPREEFKKLYKLLAQSFLDEKVQSSESKMYEKMVLTPLTENIKKYPDLSFEDIEKSYKNQKKDFETITHMLRECMSTRRNEWDNDAYQKMVTEKLIQEVAKYGPELSAEKIKIKHQHRLKEFEKLVKFIQDRLINESSDENKTFIVFVCKNGLAKHIGRAGFASSDIIEALKSDLHALDDFRTVALEKVKTKEAKQEVNKYLSFYATKSPSEITALFNEDIQKIKNQQSAPEERKERKGPKA